MTELDKLIAFWTAEKNVLSATWDPTVYQMVTKTISALEELKKLKEEE